MKSTSMGRFEGRPSIRTTMPGPWDSPAVLKASFTSLNPPLTERLAPEMPETSPDSPLQGVMQHSVILPEISGYRIKFSRDSPRKYPSISPGRHQQPLASLEKTFLLAQTSLSDEQKKFRDTHWQGDAADGSPQHTLRHAQQESKKNPPMIPATSTIKSRVVSRKEGGDTRTGIPLNSPFSALSIPPFSFPPMG